MARQLAQRVRTPGQAVQIHFSEDRESSLLRRERVPEDIRGDDVIIRARAAPGPRHGEDGARLLALQRDDGFPPSGDDKRAT